MKVVVGERQAGKTTKLIQWCAEGSDRQIAVSTHREAEVLMDMARTMGLSIPRPIVATDLARSWPSQYTLGVDNVESVLWSLLRSKVEAITVTGEVEILEEQ